MNKNSPSLLVVDDDLITLELMKLSCEDWGYTAHAAPDIATARAIALQHPIDAVISDFTLGDGSGKDLMRELHTTYGIWGIAVTGYDESTDLSMHGFKHHIGKPIDFDQLKSAIDDICAAQKKS